MSRQAPEVEPFVPRRMGRYTLRRALGRGAMGVVYEAHDTTNDAVVALKTIASSQADAAEHLFRLKQEFRALADLQHPHLIRFGELAVEGEEWFFTMELVRGCDLLSYVRPRGEDGKSVLDEARLRAALAQLVSALSALHDTGRVHRDVKPSNVLVAADGRVVVLDFGLVTTRGEQLGEAMSGTPAYMAPEQIDGTKVGPATDWYAVGAILYAALTGRAPFSGSAIDVMTAKLTETPPRPRELAPDVPPDLDALCAELLRPAPEDRPPSEDVRARVGVRVDGPLGPETQPTFVGREHELGVLQSAFAELSAPRGRTVAVEGEPGIGKSALVQRFLSGLPGRALVLFGRCYEQESMPFKGIDTIVDALSEHLLRLPERELHAILAGGVRFLATVFPVLNRVPLVAEATSNARSIDNPMALREQAFGEFERLFSALSWSRKVVLVLDDLHWADKDSLALLDRLLHQPEPPPCLFVATLRAGVELPAGVSELLADAARVSLRGLSDSESTVLCSRLLERHSAHPAQAVEREAIMHEAAGHPLYLAELLRSARRGDERAGRAAKLQDVLWERIQERDLLERRFLEVLAIAGAPIAYEVVARAAGLDVGECQTRLGSLRAAQLVRISRRGDNERLVVPYHDRVRESILLQRRSAPHAVLADHLALGRALLDSAPPETVPGRVFAVVQHLNAARELVTSRPEVQRLGRLNLLAYREAELATAYDAARSYAAIGRELLGDAGWRDSYAEARDLAVGQLRAEFLAGDVDAAAETFAAAKTRIAAIDDRNDLYVTFIELKANRGDFHAAIAVGRERLAEFGIAFPRRMNTAFLLLQYLATRWVQGRRSAEDLRALPSSTEPRHASAMKLLMAMTPAAYWISSELSGWLSLKLAQMAMRSGVSDVSSYGFATYGVILGGGFGRWVEGAAMGRLGLALNERFRNTKLTAQLHLVNGEFLAPWVQPFGEARSLLAASRDAAVKYGETAYEAFSACSLSHLAMMEGGELGAAKRVVEWARDVCVRRQDLNMAGSTLSHLHYVRMMSGETPVAFPLPPAVEPKFGASVGGPEKTPSAHDAYWEFCGWTAYMFGENEIAARCVAETRRYPQAHFGHLSTHDLCFLELLVAARAYEGAGWGRRLGLRWVMARCLRRLRVWAASCPSNFEPHYLIARGEVERVRGGDAEALFREAARLARTTGALHREALALELAAACAAARGDGAKGKALKVEAVEAYRRYGARAKADALSSARERELPAPVRP